MIIHKNIDIFQLTPCGAIIHQCNCQNTMGSGVAAIVRQKYPEAAAKDAATKCGDRSKMGSFTYAQGKDGKWIFNLYAQYSYGMDKRHTDYEAFFVGMEAIKNHMVALGFRTAAVPYKIGSDRGGASWPVIAAMLREIFDQSSIDLYICQYSPK